MIEAKPAVAFKIGSQSAQCRAAACGERGGEVKLGDLGPLPQQGSEDRDKAFFVRRLR